MLDCYRILDPVPIYGSLEAIQDSNLAVSLGESGSAVLAIAVGYICYKRQLGFVWLSEKVKIADTIKGFNLVIASVSVGAIVALQTGVMVVFERGLDAKVPVQASSLVTVAVMLGIVYIKNRKDIKDYYAKKYPADYLPK